MGALSTKLDKAIALAAALENDQLIRRLGVEANECFFWGTNAGPELMD